MDETLLGIIEHERRLQEGLHLAEKEAGEIIAQARKRAAERLEQERGSLSSLDKGYQEKLERDLAEEKKKILKEKERELKSIKEIDRSRLSELREFVLGKVAPL